MTFLPWFTVTSRLVGLCHKFQSLYQGIAVVKVVMETQTYIDDIFNFAPWCGRQSQQSVSPVFHICQHCYNLAVCVVPARPVSLIHHKTPDLVSGTYAGFYVIVDNLWCSEEDSFCLPVSFTGANLHVT